MVAGDVEELPEGVKEFNPSMMRIRPTHDEEEMPQGHQVSAATTTTPTAAEASAPFSS